MSLHSEIKKLVTLTFTLMLVLSLFGQPYPVNVTFSILPPYTSNIYKEYKHFSITLVSTKEVNCFIRFSVTSDAGIQLSTKLDCKPPKPIHLYPGIATLVVVTSEEDEWLYCFNPNHLVLAGTTKEALMANGLPEGFYSFCIRAFDYTSGAPLSGENPNGCFNINISQPDPPKILSPSFGESVLPATPQNVFFSWIIPPGAPVNTSYTLKIIELLPTDQSIEDAIQSDIHPKFFEKTVTSTSYTLNPVDPQLVAGKKYAFTVTANDPANKTNFKNNGMSEVGSFIYGKGVEKCGAPCNVAGCKGKCIKNANHAGAHNCGNHKVKKNLCGAKCTTAGCVGTCIKKNGHAGAHNCGKHKFKKNLCGAKCTTAGCTGTCIKKNGHAGAHNCGKHKFKKNLCGAKCTTAGCTGTCIKKNGHAGAHNCGKHKFKKNLCGAKCTTAGCTGTCIKKNGHAGAHNCGKHKFKKNLCGAKCTTTGCSGTCIKKAGHAGAHNCGKHKFKKNLCGAKCTTAGCSGTCIKKAGHAGAHNCGKHKFKKNLCGAKCTTAGCNGTCIKKQGHEGAHNCGKHKFKDQCGQPCTVSSCKGKCIKSPGHLGAHNCGQHKFKGPELINPMVIPSSGSDTTMFSFSVIYTDSSGNVPLLHEVVIDYDTHSMVTTSGYPASGMTFEYKTTLSAGMHFYLFQFDDGQGHALKTSTFQGPNVMHH